MFAGVGRAGPETRPYACVCYMIESRLLPMCRDSALSQVQVSFGGTVEVFGTVGTLLGTCHHTMCPPKSPYGMRRDYVILSPNVQHSQTPNDKYPIEESLRIRDHISC